MFQLNLMKVFMKYDERFFIIKNSLEDYFLGT
jgi:hypothetical protein